MWLWFCGSFQFNFIRSHCIGDPARPQQHPPNPKPQILTAEHNATFLWGTYQPNQYFGVKSRTAPATLASGLLWHGPGFSIEQARAECRQEDRIRKCVRTWGWIGLDRSVRVCRMP